MKLNVSVFELLFKDDSYNMSQGIQQNSSRNSMQMLYRLKRMSFSRISLLFRVPFEWEHSMGKDMIRLNRRILRLRCLGEFWAFLVDNKRKGTLAKIYLYSFNLTARGAAVCRVWDIFLKLTRPPMTKPARYPRHHIVPLSPVWSPTLFATKHGQQDALQHAPQSPQQSKRPCWNSPLPPELLLYYW